MVRFWDLVIEPLVRAVGARRLVEVGVFRGDCTRRILDYCADVGGHLDYVDPEPQVDLARALAGYEKLGAWHPRPSLEALPTLDTPDVVFIDGDHNWYTVHHELRAIHARARDTGRDFPLVFFHDVSWPYGRRDLYYAPERIPEEHRQPYRQKGMLPGRSELVDEGGLNRQLYNAAHEGGPKNGVLTAIEDFLAEEDVGTLVVLPVVFGLGILVPKRLLGDANFMALVDRWQTAEGRERLLFFLEQQRINEFIPAQLRAAELKELRSPPATPKLSVVVVVYDIGREAPRTLRSLSAAYQRNIDASEYEVIVVENGSPQPLGARAVAAFGPNFSYHFLANASSSPAGAINFGLRHARGNLVGVMIDGARICTPGLLRGALRASAAFDNPIVASLGYGLGSGDQRDAIARGYDRHEEDRLLERIGWPNDGYRLFEIGDLDGASNFFSVIAESNALFLRRSLWATLGGADERYDSPGGGFCNLDLFARACEAPGTDLVVLLGEGTFHQLHGGVAMNSPLDLFPERLREWRAQYERLRGKRWAPPEKERSYFGALHPAFLARMASEHRSAFPSPEIAALKSKVDQLSRESEQMRASRSWRVTAPLRLINQRLRRRMGLPSAPE